LKTSTTRGECYAYGEKNCTDAAPFTTFIGGALSTRSVYIKEVSGLSAINMSLSADAYIVSTVHMSPTCGNNDVEYGYALLANGTCRTVDGVTSRHTCFNGTALQEECMDPKCEKCIVSKRVNSTTCEKADDWIAVKTWCMGTLNMTRSTSGASSILKEAHRVPLLVLIYVIVGFLSM
ncbi:hypothetical protein HK102_002579, partial [Quaeritorhiza haematococci]